MSEAQTFQGREINLFNVAHGVGIIGCNRAKAEFGKEILIIRCI